MQNLPRGYVVGAFTIAFVSYLSRHELPPMDWRDYVAFAIFGLLIWWCFSPRRDASLMSADAHEQARQGIAFRLGKALNGVLRGHSRRA